MIDVILNQRALRLAHRLLDSMKLLGNIHAFATVFDHSNDASQVAVRTLEAFDNRLVGLVRVVVEGVVLTHGWSLLVEFFRLAPYPPWGDEVKCVADGFIDD